MTIYAETGYGKPILSSAWIDTLVYSENDDSQRAILMNIITEGFDFEKGYEYTLSVKKITQADPYLLRYILLDIKDKQKK